MNKIIIAIIATFIATMFVLIAQPKAPQNIQFTNANLGYNSVNSFQNTNTNVANINNIKDTDIVIKDTSEIENKDLDISNMDNIANRNLSLQMPDRDAYMEKLRSKAKNMSQNEQIDERLAEENIIKKSYENRLKRERENPVREQVYNQIETRKAEEKARIEAKIIASRSNVVEYPPQITNSKTKKEWEEEDTIDWSIWHSNIANTILRKTSTQNAEKSTGTSYIISFYVDKNRKITNVNIRVAHKPKGADPEPYRNSVKRAIAQINGTNILTFPSRSKRTITKFQVGIGIEEMKKNERYNPYSNPSWFPDIEVNKRKYN